MTKLTTKARNSLKPNSFVFPGERSYPIENKSHARNALARVSQHGSASQKAKVRAAVHRKFPGIGKKAGGGSVVLGEGEPPKQRADKASRCKG